MLPSRTEPTAPAVAVVGLGGAGVNAVAHLRDVGVPGVRLVAADTSGQTLARAAGMTTVSLNHATRGLGTGGDPRLGAAAVLGAERALLAAVADTELVFIVAGLAGGTGGGGAPEVARLVRRTGAIAVGCGVMPFGFECARRADAAAAAREALREACDTTVTLDNERALAVAAGDVTLDVALRVADDVLRQAVQGLNELVDACGWINVDLPMLRRLLSGAGDACLALGVGRGPRPAHAAMRAALSSPLADMRALGRAGAVLVQVTGGPDLTIADTAGAVELLRRGLAPDTDLVVGAGLDAALPGAAQVTLLGTGVATETRARRAPVRWPYDGGTGHDVVPGAAALEPPIRRAG